MQSRVREFIIKKKDEVGMALIGIGLMIILAAAGIDDAAVTAGLAPSLWGLIPKIAIGIGIAAQGLKILNTEGGAQ